MSINVINLEQNKLNAELKPKKGISARVDDFYRTVGDLSALGIFTKKLTQKTKEAYDCSAPAKSGVGISNLFQKRAYKLSIEELFLCPKFNGGLYGGSSERRFSFDGITNSVQSVTQLLVMLIDGSLNSKEGLCHD